MSTPTGNVTLAVDGGSSVSGTLANGSYQFNVGILNAGSHSLVANYAAQGLYLASSATASITITPAPLTVTAGNQGKTYGDALALGTTAFTAT
jgi:hypothetical protein